MKSVLSRSMEETLEVGRKFGESLCPSDVVALIGPLGAGKTVFVKGMALALGVRDLVVSPSYTLIHEYEGRIPLFHFDLYRLSGCGEVEDLGYEEYFSSEGVCVVEWADVCRNIFSPDHYCVRITPEEADERRIVIRKFRDQS